MCARRCLTFVARVVCDSRYSIRVAALHGANLLRYSGLAGGVEDPKASARVGRQRGLPFVRRLKSHVVRAPGSDLNRD
jgi:hypothetical protein